MSGGLFAGIFFTIVQMVVAWIAGGTLLDPLLRAASIPLNTRPEFVSTAGALVAGGLFQIIYLTVVGILTAYFIERGQSVHRTRGAIVTFASFVGLAVWIINYYIIAPLIGATWFATDTNPFVQFLLHTFVYGSILGWYLDANPPVDLVSQQKEDQAL